MEEKNALTFDEAFDIAVEPWTKERVDGKPLLSQEDAELIKKSYSFQNMSLRAQDVEDLKDQLAVAAHHVRTLRKLGGSANDRIKSYEGVTFDPPMGMSLEEKRFATVEI